MRILLVEDSVDDAELLMLALEEGQFAARVHRVETRTQLVSALADGVWDLMICDNNLPDLDATRAIELARAATQSDPLPLPIIVMSGDMELGKMVEVMRLGARDCLDKAALPKLIPVLERELAHARIARELLQARTTLAHQEQYRLTSPLPGSEGLLAHLQGRLENRIGQAAALLLLQPERTSGDSLRRRGPEAWRAWQMVTAQRLAGICGPSDFLAYLDDGSFALVLADGGDASHLAHRAAGLGVVFEAPFLHDGQPLAVACCIGACLLHGLDSPMVALHAATTALCTVLARHQGGYCLHTPELHRDEQRRRALADTLSQALERNEFLLHYQPQVDARSRVVAAEALLRWHHPTLGPVSPLEFIPLLEESGGILEVTRWVLEEACRQVCQWERDGLPAIDIAVNIPARLFGHGELIPMVRFALAASSLLPQRLELEITEGTAIKDKAATLETMAKIRSLGVRIAMDDFGVGYSCLGYLKQLPLDTLKIDRVFVADVVDSETDRNIVRAIIAMGHSLGLQVIAEGIETPAQRDFLANAGCDLIQGYLVSKPLPAGAFGEMLLHAFASPLSL
ncbi:MAG TPA: EAL domain-containing protein [Azospira sp.]|nr:EAL domain-containing protein [Azospira sp.]